MVITKPLNDLSVYLNHLVKGRLWLKVIIGLVLGAGVGVMINPSFGIVSEGLSHTLGGWLRLPGEIFMKMVQMVMIPLVFASIITGLVSNVSDKLRTFGLGLFLYFVMTTVVAISVGVLIAFLFRPGEYVRQFGGFHGADASGTRLSGSSEPVLRFPESITNLIPANPLEAFLTGEMLSVVIFTIIVGVAITQLESSAARPLIHLIESVQKICMTIIGWAMRLVPYAVFGLIASLLSTTGFDILLGLGYYMLLVILGLTIMMTFYLILYALIIGKNPFHFIGRIKEAQLLAFSTASSAAVMPLSMKIADEELGVSSRVSDFVIPIGATINMDGTAMFQCITVLFMAQVYGIELAVLDVILITTTVVSASIGTPAIPGGGIIILASVLKGSGIPAEGLLVIIGIDRILGMFRTAVNVTGDLTATVIFNRWFGARAEEAAGANVPAEPE